MAIRTLIRCGLLAAQALVAALAPGVALCQNPSREKVDLELILMVDGSGSIDDQEFALQRQGYIKALQDPRVLEAIQIGPLRKIALAYVEWSGPSLQAVIAPWRAVANAADMAAFTETLLRRPRLLYGGGTAPGAAILYAVDSLRDNDFDGRRQVIDVSGDGPDRDGIPARMGRDRAVAEKMTVNGLPILDGFPDLANFFEDNVIGGPGAFSIPANSFKDFATAIRMKLIREIAGTEEFEETEVARR